MNPRELAEHLASRGTYRYSRSSGPGGQRRDKVETAVELVIDGDALSDLPDDLARRLRRGLDLDTHPLRVSADGERSRERNREAVLARLEERLTRALRPPAPPRRATRPSRAAKRRRLQSKRHRGRLKKQRGRPARDD